MTTLLKHSILGILFLASLAVRGQTEADIAKRANKLFEEGKYLDAKRDFESLLSLNQTSPEYNFKYGTCLLFSDGNKSQSLKYLRYASQNASVAKECWFWLGKAYHVNYQFADAIKAYQKFSSLASAKEKEKYQVDRHIEMCNNGKRLLKNISEIIVLDKRDYKESEFFRLYSMDNIGGQIIVVDELKTSLDKKNNHRIVVHNPKKSDVIFYSSYGEDGKTGKDIYMVNRLPNGGWAKSQIVRGGVNTPYDEDFPYMHPNGKTLYFCSKGHNSMGGYDVFKSEYNESSGTFGPAENVDFAISSPDDDFLYIVDSLDRNAWFASARESQDGKIYVYNVRVDRIPVLISIIKGKFQNEIDKTNLSATIRIEDMVNNELVGIFNTRKDGDYLISLDKSGRYKFTVIPDHSKKEHTAVVEIPYQKEIRPLKQEIAIILEDGEEKLVIRNLFSEILEDAELIIAEVMRDKSLLNPNATSFNLEELDRIKDSIANERIDSALSMNLTNDDLLKMVKEDAEELQKEANELKSKSEAAFVVANQKNNDAKEKATQAEKLLASIDASTTPQEKEQIIANAEELNRQSEIALKEAAAAYELGKSFSQQYENKQKEANTSLTYSKGIEEALASNNHKEAIEKLKQQQEFIKGVMAPDVNKTDALTDLKIKAQQRQEDANKALDYAQDLRKEEEGLNRKIKNLQEEYAATGNSKRKKEIEKELEQLTDERSNLQSNVKKAFERQKTIQQEADALTAQVNVMEEITLGGITVTLSQTEKDALGTAIASNEAGKVIEKNNQLLAASEENKRNDRVDMNEYFNANPDYNKLNSKESEIAAIKDDKTRLEEENKLNEQWIETIDNDIKNLNTELASETNPEKKTKIENTIKGLEEQKTEKRNETATNTKKLEEIEKDNVIIASTSPGLTTNQLKNVEEVEPGYASNIESINTNSKNENEKALKRTEANEELVERIDEKINQLVEERKTATDKTAVDKKIAELTEVKTIKENEIKTDEKTLAENKIIKTDSKGDPLFSYTENNNFESTEAKNLAKNTDSKIEQIKTSEDKITGLKIQRSETTDEKEKKNIDKQITKEEEKLTGLELAVAGDIQKANEAEQTTMETRVGEKNEKLQTYPQAINSPQYAKAQELEQKAKDNFIVAAALRNRAKDEKDKKIRNELLLQAAEAEHQANQYLREADKLYDILLDEYVITIASTNPVNEVIKTETIYDIQPGYESSMAAINNSTKTEEEKAKDRLALNRSLVSTIEKEEKEIAEQIKNNNGNPEELKQRQETLAGIKTEKENEIRKDENIISEAVTTVVTPVSTDLTEKQQDEIAAIDNSFLEKKNEIKNSDKSEARKANEEKNLNEKMLTDIDNKISELETQLVSPTVADKEEKNKQLETLKETRTAIAADLEENNKTLEENGIKNENRDAVSYTENKTYTSENAVKETAPVAEKIKTISTTEENLEELKIKRAETTDEKTIKELDKQIKKEEDKLVTQELAVAPAIEKANAAEKTANDKKLEMVKEEADMNNIPLTNPQYTRASQLETKAEREFKTAEELRLQAAREKDKAKRNELLKEANEAEQRGLKYQDEAENTYSALLADFTITASAKKMESVPESVEDRESTRLLNDANRYRNQAEELNLRATNLEEQAKTAKKKQRQPLLDEAAGLREDAAKLTRKAQIAEQQGNEIKWLEDEYLAQQLLLAEEEKRRKELTPIVRKWPEYARYYDLAIVEVAARKNFTESDNESKRLSNLAQTLRGEANDLRTKADNETDPQRKNDLIAQAEQVENNAAKTQSRSDSLKIAASRFMIQSDNARLAVNNYLSAIDQNKSKDILFVVNNYKNLVEPEKQEVTPEALAANNFTAPETVSTNLFTKTQTSSYSNNNPIPVNPKMPSGAYFKVQVGAFRNRIPQDLYKDFAPVSGETTPNGLTRYTVGYFTDLNSADAAKTEIRGAGYRDAFVVAFCNGVRIPIANINNCKADGAVAVNPVINPVNPVVNPVNPVNPVVNPVNPNAANYYTSVEGAAPANQVEVISGLFYTVQVGVYSRPVSPDKLFNIAPLNSELTPNRQVRYTTGIFTDLNTANTRKDQVRAIGIADAFVTAYMNGKRITVEQAADSIRKYGNSVFADPNNLKNPGMNPVNPVVNNNGKYKVVLGTYQGTVPVKDAEIFLANISKGIKKIETTDGKSLYYIDGIPNETEANNLKNEFAAKGLTGVYVTETLPVSGNPTAITNGNPEGASVAKNVSGLKFQVYLGEYLDEVPREDAEVFLSNSSKGVKQKLKEGYKIYYVCDCTNYDQAMEMKAFFFSEGLTSVRIVSLKDENEISLSEALKLIYE